MLQMLYRSAGLSLKMPPDMVEDPKLRERMYQEFQTIGRLFQEILDLGKEQGQQPDSAFKPDYNNVILHHGHADEDNGVEADEDEEWQADSLVEGAENYAEVAGYILEEDDIMTALGEVAPELTGTMTYAALSYFAGTVFSTIGMLCTAYGLIKGLKTEGALTGALKGEMVTDSVGEFVSGFGSATWGISSFIEVLTADAEAEGEAAGVWLANASDSLWSQIGEAGYESLELSDKILFVGGVAIAAGGVLKTVSSGISMGRAVSSGHDVKRSKQKLGQREAEAQQDGGELTEDEKRLKSFLKHQDTAVGRQKSSAGVGIATGVLTIATGVFLSTGFAGRDMEPSCSVSFSP